MERINPPSEKEYMEYLGIQDSKRKKLCEKVQDRVDKLRERINGERNSINLARQYEPFRKKLQEVADSFIGKWVFIEKGENVTFVEEPTVASKPIILYGMSMSMTTRIAVDGELGKELVDKDGKVIDLSFRDMYLLDRIQLDVIMLRGKMARVIPNVIYNDYYLSQRANLVENITENLSEVTGWNRMYHTVRNLASDEAKTKSIEFLRVNKENIMGSMEDDRAKIIKAYDYITEYAGTLLFDGNEVLKLFGSYR